MLLDRLRVGFTGGQIGSGVATHYALNGGGHQPDFKTFWNNLGDMMGTTTNLNVPSEGDIIEVETGKLQNVWSEGTPLSKIGQGGASHAAGVGCCITWLTAGIRNGHRVRGRTFVVPLSGGCYDTDGTIGDTYLSQIRGHASTLIAACGEDFMIYSRPRGDNDDGVAYPVIGYRVADRVSSLRSRR